MGISVAKHRLEILKLAKKEDVPMLLRTKKLSGVIKKCLKKCMNMVFGEDQEGEVKGYNMTPEPNWYQGKWRRALVKKYGTEELKGEKGMYRSRTIALSGPLDGRMHDHKMVSGKVLKLSGPLDGKMNERMMYTTDRSPITTRPIDGRFMGRAKSPTTLHGPFDATRGMVNSKSPRLIRPSDHERGESPICYSPYNKKIKHDSDYDDGYALWPTLFEDLKPT